MALPTFTLFVNCVRAATVVGRAGIKAYCKTNNLPHVFAVRDDGIQYNCVYRNGRLNVSSAP